MRLRDTAKFGLPIAVADHPVDMAFTGIGLPAGFFRSGEIDVGGRTGRIVGVEDRLDRVLADKAERDRRFDPLRRHIGDFLVDQLRGICAARTLQAAAFEPLTRDAL